MEANSVSLSTQAITSSTTIGADSNNAINNI
jgi:hypothetical protein